MYVVFNYHQLGGGGGGGGGGGASKIIVLYMYDTNSLCD